MATKPQKKVKVVARSRNNRNKLSKASKSKSMAAPARRLRPEPARPKHPQPAAPPPRPEANPTPKLVPAVPVERLRASKGHEMSERSAHLEKLKHLFETSPISRFLGMTLGYCENGVARVRLPYRKEFEEGHNVIHGGMIGLLGDTAGNYAVGSVSPGSAVKTVEFKLSLLAGVQGDLLAIGEVVRKGRTLATCRLEVVEGNDRVVAVGLATYALQAV